MVRARIRNSLSTARQKFFCATNVCTQSRERIRVSVLGQLRAVVGAWSEPKNGCEHVGHFSLKRCNYQRPHSKQKPPRMRLALMCNPREAKGGSKGAAY